MQLSLRHITKQFNNQLALEEVSLDIEAGEIVCLLGPSGCGKTTLLRIIAGLETADSGQVLLDDQDLTTVPSHRRDFGLMFQDFALFPHKSVFENVAFGLRMQRGRGAREQRSRGAGRVGEMLRLVGLEGFEKRSVTQLSGGEAQRVALARSLAPNPRLLMLDEPLGSLDRALRERLMVELRDILKTVGVTAVYVTHDQAEAFAIADRVVVMNRGRIEQGGPPEAIYRTPATPFVAHFLGLSNLANGEVREADRVASPWGELTVATDGYVPGQTVTVLIRPEAATLYRDEAERPSPPFSSSGREGHISPPRDNVIKLPPPARPKGGKKNQIPPSRGLGGLPLTHLPGTLVGRSFRGGRYQVQIRPANGPVLTFDLTTVGPLPITPGDSVTFTLDPAGIVLLPR